MSVFSGEMNTFWQETYVDKSSKTTNNIRLAYAIYYTQWYAVADRDLCVQVFRHEDLFSLNQLTRIGTQI